MSEAKRVPSQTLEFPESLGYATKKEKKGEKGKQFAPSVRFTLTLAESNEKQCPEYNYAQLLKAEEKKRRKDLKRDDTTTNGLPFDEDDDDDKLRDMARRFEAKYGTKRRKYDDYVDLGAGYDENDPFIDNTDAYDEIVPEEVTTAHGGFYINSGALEFKTVDRQPVVNNNNNNQSNDDESSESSEEDTEDVDSPKRPEKRNFSSSDEEDTEDITTADQQRKKQKVDETYEKKGSENVIKKKKKPHNLQDQQNSQLDGDGLSRRKEKGETTDGEGSEDQEEKKKSEKTDMQRPKDKKFDIKKFEKKASNSNGFDSKKLELKKLGDKDSNIDDAIESVVNAARVEDESSRDTSDSQSRCIGTESEGDDADKEAPLPESLPENIIITINELKAHAENNKEGKTKFFDTSVNNLLFNLEKRLRALSTPSLRLQTYGHLARFLPCSKVALQNRAKKLFVEDIEYKTTELIQSLKKEIDDIMPSVISKYQDECQKVAERKEQEGSPEDVESSDDDVRDDISKSKLPKKQFPWTEEAKKLVTQIATMRSQCYNVSRPRKLSLFTYVESFMVRQLLPLWPHGYMTAKVLLEFIDGIEPTIKKKAKKLKEIGNGKGTSSSENVIYSSARLEASTTSTVPLQEKITANPPKIQNTTENSTSYLKGTSKLSENTEKKQHSIKSKDKIKDPSSLGQHHENSVIVSSSNSSIGKISVVPTSQLMAQKPVKSHIEKINLMDLGNSSLSITPVNDFHKSSIKINENKKDIVSITPFSEASNVLPNTNEVPQSGHHSVHRQEASYSSTHSQYSNYPTSNQASTHSKSVSIKHRQLNENADTKNDKRLEDRDLDMANKTEKRDKKRNTEVKHKSHDTKKRKKDQKLLEKQVGHVNSDVVPIQQQQQKPLFTKEEQEQKQNEETIAATNYLSQIFNDDAPSKGISDKRKDAGLVAEESASNAVQPSEQEKDVQMVMRSLKELQELQEMKYSPSNSPVGSSIQKPNKSTTQCATYQDEYSRLYLKKDVKLKSKEESQW
ncbi:ubinuclein-1 isoform X2 [Ceratina calcarata]|uniref:Ubinuclein-1 isoform X2 n=1 Tax=Ceratina calcarata TaxID=156304 RepID=A0AAJ7IUI4_9HYME|nr:ubinuclein-1 isoform X2 [Ceratina calcarata]